MLKEVLQDDQYEFPYHHIPQMGCEGFTEARFLVWGYQYASYIEHIIQLVQRMNPRSILDIGCGDGKFLMELHRASPSISVKGIDFSERAVMLARALVSGVKFEKNRIEDIKETFDMFTCIEVIEHIPPIELDPFLQSCSRILVPNGSGIITVPSINLPLNKKHYQHFDEKNLRSLLESHFEVVSIYYLNGTGIGESFIKHLLVNRLFILNYTSVMQTLYNLYTAWYLRSDSSKGTRLLAVVRKK